MDARISEFGTLLAAGRNAGPKSLGKRWLRGWVPKRPTAQEERVLEHIARLKRRERTAVLELVRYFVDLSFFKLLEILETGESGYTFELRMTTPTGVTVTLVDSKQDHSLRSRFFSWVKEHGY